MSQPEKIDVLIIGSGPAGTSTALHLLQIDPAWAGRMVLVDKAIHPREKLCGGGVTQAGENILSGLGLSFEPPHISVRELRLVYGNEAYLVQDNPVFRVTRRDEFDHWLVRQAQQQGVTVRQGEAVTDIRPGEDYIEVVTERAIFHAQVVVGADGSRSLVRRKLKWNKGLPLARLLEVLTPEAGEKPAFQSGVAVFDFSTTKAGLQGYYWDFPSLIKGRAFMNRGIFDSRARPERSRIPLKQSLARSLAERERNLEDYQLKGHPIHWFDKKGRFAMPRVILTGDAAGVDPLLGEGISFALGYGEVAAKAIADAFEQRNFNFEDYRKRILSHPLLSTLPVRTGLARFIYRLKHPWQIRLLWRVTGLIIRGFNWYRPNAAMTSSFQLRKIRL